MKMNEVFTGRVESFDNLLCLVGEEDLGALNTVQIAVAAAHAINCHDDLVEALELALSAIELYAVDLKLPSDTIGQNRLRAALKKAKG